jgi:alpha-L-glutamate ligase-like protein
MQLSSILGLNARSQLYSYRYNKASKKAIANSKIATNRVLTKAQIPNPLLFAKFKSPSQVERFDWSGLPNSFALKPSKGLGGEGIIVVKKRAEGKEAWITIQRQMVTIEDLKLHSLDILEGAYSMDSSPDVAFVQEYVGRHKAFRKYAYRGTPDIRIIIFNKIPVMAMLRLPTKESGGRANLHQGAIGVGVDIATGITTKAIWHGELIRYKPGTSRKLHGIKIPFWTSVLETAVRTQIVSGLGYGGVDIVLHPEKGPMVLEINAEPGLTIQLANMAGLRKRLDRVEGLEVKDAEHGVKIAKALFAANFSDRVKAEEGIRTIGTFETIKIKGKNGKKVDVPAKIDTGARRTSIDKTLAKDLGLLDETNILWYKRFRSALGREERPIISFTYWLKGKKIKTTAGISDRSKLRKPVIIGRKDLIGFLVNPEV